MKRPCAVGRPMALTSGYWIRRAPTRRPVRSRPNSFACLMALVMSEPPLAITTTLAFEACADSRCDEKSAVFSGCRAEPRTLPPAALTNSLAFCSRARPKA